MKNVRIEIDHGEIERQLLKGAATADHLNDIAARIATAAGTQGGTFGHDVRIGRTRAHAIVFTADFEAMRAEATNRALTKAIDAGR